MKKKTRRKIKSLVKNIILMSITILMMAVCMVSGLTMAVLDWKVFLAFVISYTWLWLFGKANSWGECPE